VTKPRPTMPVGVRLLLAVDDHLRKKQRGKGDLSKLIGEALRTTDLGLVPLLPIHGKRKTVVAKVTQVVLRKDIRQEIERWSKTRACSMNELLNSALVSSLLKTRPRRGRVSGKQTPPALLSRMTSDQRETFFGQLLALTGQERVAGLHSREGSYYEYDGEAGATVEIASDGRRFLVQSAAGGELVRVREVGQSSFVEVSEPTAQETGPRVVQRRRSRQK
jgi:hypothetical protein